MGSWKKKLEDKVRKKYIMTDPILKKGHYHEEDTKDNVAVCMRCGGWGALPDGNTHDNIMCPACEGTGEVYK